MNEGTLYGHDFGAIEDSIRAMEAMISDRRHGHVYVMGDECVLFYRSIKEPVRLEFGGEVEGYWELTGPAGVRMVPANYDSRGTAERLVLSWLFWMTSD